MIASLPELTETENTYLLLSTYLEQSNPTQSVTFNIKNNKLKFFVRLRLSKTLLTFKKNTA